MIGSGATEWFFMVASWPLRSHRAATAEAIPLENNGINSRVIIVMDNQWSEQSTLAKDQQKYCAKSVSLKYTGEKLMGHPYFANSLAN